MLWLTTNAISPTQSNIWSAGYYDGPLMTRMAKEAEEHIQEFSQQNLANLAWAYGKLSHYEASLLDHVACQATLKVKVPFQCP